MIDKSTSNTLRAVQLKNTMGDPVIVWVNEKGQLVTPPKLCVSCQYWDFIGGKTAEDSIQGTCNKITENSDGAYFTQPSTLYTTPTFGCTLWRERQHE